MKQPARSNIARYDGTMVLHLLDINCRNRTSHARTPHWQQLCECNLHKLQATLKVLYQFRQGTPCAKMNAMWPCGRPHEVATVTGPRLSSPVVLNPLKIIVSQKKITPATVINNSQRTPVGVLARPNPHYYTRISPSRAKVEKSVSRSGVDAYWHHNYPFEVPLAGAAFKCGPFTPSHVA